MTDGPQEEVEPEGRLLTLEELFSLQDSLTEKAAEYEEAGYRKESKRVRKFRDSLFDAYNDGRIFIYEDDQEDDEYYDPDDDEDEGWDLDD